MTAEHYFWKIMAGAAFGLMGGLWAVTWWLFKAYLQQIRDDLQRMNGKVTKVFEVTDSIKEQQAEHRLHIAQDYVSAAACQRCSARD